MIPIFDYRRALPELEADLDAAFRRVLHSNALILGPETRRLERELAAWAGATDCVAVGSGTMALFLALRGLGVGPGDEVVTVANTCPPTVAAIRLTGATPVFVDVHPDSLMMDVGQVEAALTGRTRAVVPVHLWGSAADLDALGELTRRRGLALVEDCAQASGTRFRGRQVGTFGDAGCLSFYPSKNLGAYGDGGAILTDDPELAERLRRLRMYGYADGVPVSTIEGFNGRINEVQAALLRVKLPRLEGWNERRREIAGRYREELGGVTIPLCPPGVLHSHHQFVVRCADRRRVTERLGAAGVQWAIHYPTPVHLMPAYARFARPLPVTERAAGEILSIPVHEHLSDDEVSAVIEAFPA